MKFGMQIFKASEGIAYKKTVLNSYQGCSFLGRGGGGERGSISGYKTQLMFWPAVWITLHPKVKISLLSSPDGPNSYSRMNKPDETLA